MRKRLYLLFLALAVLSVFLLGQNYDMEVWPGQNTPRGFLAYSTINDAAITAGECIWWKNPKTGNVGTCGAANTDAHYLIPAGHKLFIRSLAIVVLAPLGATEKCDIELEIGTTADLINADETVTTIEVGEGSSPLIDGVGDDVAVVVNRWLDPHDWFRVKFTQRAATCVALTAAWVGVIGDLIYSP
jgi:hypothetical protein